jgi:hypothetical protein
MDWTHHEPPSRKDSKASSRASFASLAIQRYAPDLDSDAAGHLSHAWNTGREAIVGPADTGELASCEALSRIRSPTYHNPNLEAFVAGNLEEDWIGSCMATSRRRDEYLEVCLDQLGNAQRAGYTVPCQKSETILTLIIKLNFQMIIIGFL